MENILWNDSNIQAPPINTYKSDNNNIDIKKLATTIEDAINVLQNQQSFHSEATILSRLVYKLGTKFRNDIGFSFLKRTNIAVKKYLNINLLNTLTIFLDVVSDSMKGYYPTRQMLEFILIRLQTFSKLLNRIELCSKKSATFYLERIRRGDAWWLSFMPYSVLCRIWYISRHLFLNCCKWYSALFPFHNELKLVGIPFIPNNYKFPSNINQWIQCNVDEDDKLLQPSEECSLILSKLNANFDLEKYEKNTQDSNTVISCQNDVSNNLMYNNNLSDDVGEIVSRDSFISENKSSSKIVKNKHQFKENKNEKAIDKSSLHQISKNMKLNINKIHVHSIDMVKSTKSFKRFVNLEESYRKTNNNDSLTRHLGFMQWHSLKTIVNELVCKLNDKNESKILKKIQSVWKNKCTVLKD